MKGSPQTWLWVCAAVSLIVGVLLVMKDSGAGWFLIIMAIIDVGAATRTGRGLTPANRGMTLWGLIMATILVAVLVLLAAVVLLRSA